MARQVVGCLVSCLLLAVWASPASGDGGTVRVSRRRGDYRITVFTSPTPLRAGPVDVSVLVQDADTGETQHDLQIEVRASKAGRPSATVRQGATSQAATNKLFHAAQLELSQPGRWEFLVTVAGPQHSEQLQFAVEAADRLPAWQSMWPWFTWPLLVIFLFAVRSRRP